MAGHEHVIFRDRIKAYLLNAEEARRRASFATDVQAKASWTTLAESWQRLAEQTTRPEIKARVAPLKQDTTAP